MASARQQSDCPWPALYAVFTLPNICSDRAFESVRAQFTAALAAAAGPGERRLHTMLGFPEQRAEWTLATWGTYPLLRPEAAQQSLLLPPPLGAPNTAHLHLHLHHPPTPHPRRRPCVPTPHRG